MIRNLFILLAFSILLWNCNTAKKGMGTTVMPKMNVSDLQKVIEDHNVDFEWFSGKAKIVVNQDGNRVGGTIQIRMKKNEQIWMSISKLGFEVVRAMITPDSAYVMDRFNRDYYKENLDDYLADFKVPFSFTELQGLLLGNIPYEKGRRTNTKIQSNQYLYSHITKEDWFYEYKIDPELEIRGLFVSDPDEREVVSVLDDYETIGSHTIPMFISHEINDGLEVVAMQLDYSQAEFDIQKNMPFEVPAHYTRID